MSSPAPAFTVARLNGPILSGLLGGLPPQYTATLSASVAAGDNLIVGVSVTAGTVSGIMDSKGQKYTLIGSIGSGTNTLYVFQCTGQSGTAAGSAAMLGGKDTITAQLTSGSSTPINLWAVDVPGTYQLDAIGAQTATGTSATISKATGTLAQAGETVIAFSWDAGGGGSPAWSAPMTQVGGSLSGNSAGFMGAAYNQVTSTATTTPTATITSALWLIVVVAFRNPEAAGAVDSFVVSTGTPVGDLSATIRQPGWMSDGPNVHKCFQTDPVTTRKFFDTQGSFISGGNPTVNPVQDGLAAEPLLNYTTYAQFVADVTNAPFTQNSIIYNPNGPINKTIFQWLRYDIEGGGTWPTPIEEKQDPQTYIGLFITLAHANGFNVILTPGRDLGSTDTAHPKRSGETDDQWYIRTNIPAACSKAEIFEVQDQANQGNPAEFVSFFNSARAEAKAARRGVQVWCGLSTTYGDGSVMFDSWQSVQTADGFWANIIGNIADTLDLFRRILATLAPQATETGGAAESLSITTFGITSAPAPSDAAGVAEGISVVNTTALAPWILAASADSTTSRIIVATSAANLVTLQVGQQFQIYSGSLQQPGEGRLNSNFSFESGTSPWAGQNGVTLAQSTLNPWTVDAGTHSCQMTFDGVTASGQMISEFIALPAGGRRYSAYGRVTASVAWASGARLSIRFFDVSNTLVATFNGPTVALSGGVQTVLTVPECQPPATATQVRLVLQAIGTVPATTFFYADIVYVYNPETLLQRQIFTITALGSAFGFTNIDFTPAAAASTVFWNTAHQVLGGVPAQPQAPAVFVRSRMPRCYAQNIITGAWLNRDIQGIQQPLITWNLDGADTFTCTISPPRPDLKDANGEPLLVMWSTALYLEEGNDIKFGGIITDQTFDGPNWGITATGFAGYPNGMPYEGPVYKQTAIDALDVVRYLWKWLQDQPNGNLGFKIGTAQAGVQLGAQMPPPDWITKLKGGANKRSIAVQVDSLTGVTVGQVILVGDETHKVKAVGNIPAHIKYHGAGPKPGTHGTYITLNYPLDHFHAADSPVQHKMKPTPFELDWWNSTDIGQEISSIMGEAVFDYQEKHDWSGPEKIDVIHSLKFGVPRIGNRHAELRFVEGENLTVPGQIHQDGSVFANNVIGLGAGQGRAQLRVTVSQLGSRLRRSYIYTDQTIKRPERLTVKARRQMTSRIASVDTVTTVIVKNHPSAPFGSFAIGDDIPVQLATGWRRNTFWSRILSMQQDPTTDQMTLTLARSDSFTYMAQTGQAGTL
jgi:hypothetical protein